MTYHGLAEEILKEKIESLEKVINFRNHNVEWRSSHDGGGFQNDYIWDFCGVCETYDGKLSALKELLEEIRKNI